MKRFKLLRRNPNALSDTLGSELREALVVITKRAMRENPDRDKAWTLTLQGCRISGVSIGDWEIRATPLPTLKIGDQNDTDN